MYLIRLIGKKYGVVKVDENYRVKRVMEMCNNLQEAVATLERYIEKPVKKR